MTLTLETAPSAIRAATTTQSALDAMTREQAFAAMERDYANASDKVAARALATANGGHARATLRAPLQPGTYTVKALVVGDRSAAVGHARVRVAR